MKRKRLSAVSTVCLLLSGCGIPIESGSAAPGSIPATAHQASSEQTTLSTTATETSLTEDLLSLPAGTVLRNPPESTEGFFQAKEIPDAVFSKMNGISFRENPHITREELRLLRVLHYTPSGAVQIGEMIVNQKISEDVLDILLALYHAQYPIERMVLIDEYGGDDEASMAANNSSCFNYRVVANTNSLSNHALGLAVDINPLYNPYITFHADGTQQIAPANAAAYADRTKEFEMKIDESDLCLRLFREHGFTWGGDWTTAKDYQHFEKTVFSDG